LKDELNLKTERASVYAAIDSEREYQDSAWPANAGVNAPVRTIAEELMLIEEYAARMRALWTDTARPDEPVVLTPFFRKIAALAVRAMENHGAPGREGYGVFVQPSAPFDADDIPF
jgi:hypothetical protein